MERRAPGEPRWVSSTDAAPHPPGKVTVDSPPGRRWVQAVPRAAPLPCQPSRKHTAESQGTLAVRVCDSAHVARPPGKTMARARGVRGVIYECRNARGLHTLSQPRKGLPSQPGKRENWEVRHPVSSRVTPGRAARGSPPGKGREGRLKGTRLCQPGWTGAPVSGNAWALESYSFRQSQYPQIQSFSLPR